MDKIIEKLTRVREMRRDVVLTQVRRQEAVLEAAREALRRAEGEVARLLGAKAAAGRSLASRMLQGPNSARELVGAGIDWQLFDDRIEAARERTLPAQERMREEAQRLEALRETLRRADAKRDQAERTGERIERAAARRAEAADEARAEEAALRTAIAPLGAHEG
ncbi:hypothetical protein [Trinickia dinghuensis]|uniref:Uncharacterized protein n=1 Tax=Trinickia dinghuensis TaxID=2291023 RepID=A0A3D8JY43_9BURK|nr:hypothetical protein [Trinickia dinghuensis]RDU98063.1 hypothetical protein DWV00_16235 [Trinickia dinghuensis]